MGFLFQNGLLDTLTLVAVCWSVFVVLLDLYRRLQGDGFSDYRRGGAEACIGELQPTNREPEATDREPKANDREPEATDREPEATDREPEPTDRVHEATDRDPEAREMDSSVSPKELLLQEHRDRIRAIRDGCKSLYRILTFPERGVVSSLPEELMPGLPNNVTLSHIVTKLSWVSQRSLMSVSRIWRYAISTNTIYDARVLSGATETFAVFVHEDSKGSLAMSLYSMGDKLFYPLAPIVQDGHIEDLSKVSQYLSLDGKLFLFGAYCLCDPVGDLCSDQDCDKQGYVLNLASHSGQWKRFTVDDLAVLPRQGSICFGDRFQENTFTYNRKDMSPSKPSSQKEEGNTNDFVKSNWVAAIFSKTSRQMKIFAADKKVYFIEMRGRTQQIIALANRADLNSKWHLQSISCDHIVPTDAVRVVFTFVIPVNGELLTLARWERDECFEYCLLRSKGFGTDTKEILWQKEAYPPHFDLGTCFPMCLIEL